MLSVNAACEGCVYALPILDALHRLGEELLILLNQNFPKRCIYQALPCRVRGDPRPKDACPPGSAGLGDALASRFACY